MFKISSGICNADCGVRSAKGSLLGKRHYIWYSLLYAGERSDNPVIR
jgi:hypothetical protein